VIYVEAFNLPIGLLELLRMPRHKLLARHVSCCRIVPTTFVERGSSIISAEGDVKDEPHVLEKALGTHV